MSNFTISLLLFVCELALLSVLGFLYFDPLRRHLQKLIHRHQKTETAPVTIHQLANHLAGLHETVSQQSHHFHMLAQRLENDPVLESAITAYQDCLHSIQDTAGEFVLNQRATEEACHHLIMICNLMAQVLDENIGVLADKLTDPTMDTSDLARTELLEQPEETGDDEANEEPENALEEKEQVDPDTELINDLIRDLEDQGKVNPAELTADEEIHIPANLDDDIDERRTDAPPVAEPSQAVEASNEEHAQAQSEPAQSSAGNDPATEVAPDSESLDGDGNYVSEDTIAKLFQQHQELMDEGNERPEESAQEQTALEATPAAKQTDSPADSDQSAADEDPLPSSAASSNFVSEDTIAELFRQHQKEQSPENTQKKRAVARATAELEKEPAPAAVSDIDSSQSNYVTEDQIQKLLQEFKANS